MERKSLLCKYVIVILLITIITMTLTSTSRAPTLPHLYVDPSPIIDETKTAGTTFQVNITVADVTSDSPLVAYEFKIAWDIPMLNYTIVQEGPFLAQGGDTWFVVQKSQASGTISFGCWLLAPYTPVDGSGVLVSITFKVEQYGETYLDLYDNVLLTEGYPPEYDPLPMDHTVEDGYFNNLIPGDMTDDSPGVPPDLPDGDVDGFDLGAFADAYGSSAGQPRFNHLGDLTDDSPGVPPDFPDGDVDGFDLGVFADNYGRSLP